MKLPEEVYVLARKKKSKPFRAVTAVKAAAREVVGTPPPTRRDPDLTKETRKKPKHKKTLERLLSDQE
ncbi:MAG: hypothetical protein JWN45_3552 [Acidobacteriaceae bacterium]|nr:hypothetical protein [Acidobacteriaceae bacterium]